MKHIILGAGGAIANVLSRELIASGASVRLGNCGDGAGGVRSKVESSRFDWLTQRPLSLALSTLDLIGSWKASPFCA
jgi:hypothetical protein